MDIILNILQSMIYHIDILKRYLGYGFYKEIITGQYTTVPEFAIPCNEFKIKYITHITDAEKDEYLRKQSWKFYKSSIPREYLADYECGSFKPGYDENSILNYNIDKVLSLSKN